MGQDSSQESRFVPLLATPTLSGPEQVKFVRIETRRQPQLPRNPFRLADLPPEIRILIFTEHLKWKVRRDTNKARKRREDKGSKTPNLIKALRPDKKMYTEALDIFFDLSTFTVSSNNGTMFKYMTRETLERVRCLETCYGFTIDHRAWRLELAPSFPVKLLFRCMNVRQICISTAATILPGSGWPKTLRSLVKETIVQLPRLQILYLVIPHPKLDDGSDNDKRMDLLTESIDKSIGIEHSKTGRKFTWDAGKGRTLTWTDAKYWRSIQWNNVNDIYIILTMFHRLYFWAPLNLHFLGLNPRSMSFGCAKDGCGCIEPGKNWGFKRPVGPSLQSLSTVGGESGSEKPCIASQLPRCETLHDR